MIEESSRGSVTITGAAADAAPAVGAASALHAACSTKCAALHMYMRMGRRSP